MKTCINPTTIIRETTPRHTDISMLDTSFQAYCIKTNKYISTTLTFIRNEALVFNMTDEQSLFSIPNIHYTPSPNTNFSLKMACQTNSCHKGTEMTIDGQMTSTK